MERGITLDYSHWPLVVQRVGLHFDMDDMVVYLKDLDALHARNERFASVVLVKQRGTMDRKVIGQYGAWVKANRQLMERYYLGCAFVFPGEVFRFILSAILLAAPAPVPHDVFGTADEACRWALAKLHKAGVKTPVLNMAAIRN